MKKWKLVSHFALLIFIFTLPGMVSGQDYQEMAPSRGKDQFQFQVDFQYLNMSYEEPGVMTEKGQLPGIRVQARWNPTSSIGFSLGGSYFDGHLNYDGQTFAGVPVRQITADYIREYRTLFHFSIQQLEIAAGFANRRWFNDLVISYTRTTEYTYFPLKGTYFFNPFYFSAEYRLWGKGKNVSTMSDVNPASQDVTFNQNSGNGYALEIGVQYPFGPIEAQIHLIYDYWDVADSDIQSDGTQLLIEPQNNTQSFILGFGLIF